MRSDVRLSGVPLPQHSGVRPVWPGSQVGDLFVRRGPAGREPGLFVHGLGGSATNWTAAEEVRRRNGLSSGQDAFHASLRGLIASYLVRGERSLRARAARVQAPTLLVRGDRDRLVDVAIAPRAVQTCPDVRLLVLAGVGHVAQMERPEVVARAFLGMLEELAERDAVPHGGS